MVSDPRRILIDGSASGTLTHNISVSAREDDPAAGNNSDSTDTEVLLVDAGISRKRIVQGLKDLDISHQDVKYILVTHAHSDHINSLAILEGDPLMKFKLIATRETLQEIQNLSTKEPRYKKGAKKETLKENQNLRRIEPRFEKVAKNGTFSFLHILAMARASALLIVPIMISTFSL